MIRMIVKNVAGHPDYKTAYHCHCSCIRSHGPTKLLFASTAPQYPLRSTAGLLTGGWYAVASASNRCSRVFTTSGCCADTSSCSVMLVFKLNRHGLPGRQARSVSTGELLLIGAEMFGENHPNHPFCASGLKPSPPPKKTQQQKKRHSNTNQHAMSTGT